MKKIVLNIGIGILNIIYFFIKFARTKDKITYISEEYNYMGKNIKDGIKIVHYIGNTKP